MSFWNSLAFSMVQRILAIWSLVPLPFLNPAQTSGSFQFIYCVSLAWRILNITLLACEMSASVLCDSLNIFWYCLSLGLDWKPSFSSPVATAEFSRFAGIFLLWSMQSKALAYSVKHCFFLCPEAHKVLFVLGIILTKIVYRLILEAYVF